MDVKLDKWFRPKIDKEVLRKLSKKSDLKGMLHVGIYFCFLIITGLFAYYTYLTKVFAIIVYVFPFLAFTDFNLNLCNYLFIMVYNHINNLKHHI